MTTPASRENFNMMAPFDHGFLEFENNNLKMLVAERDSRITNLEDQLRLQKDTCTDLAAKLIQTEASQCKATCSNISALEEQRSFSEGTTQDFTRQPNQGKNHFY